jgi:serine/threonine protein kinase
LAHTKSSSALVRGEWGEAWKARDTRLGRVMAIKKVKEQHSERFKQEARSIAALNHPYICQLFDVGPDYLILEYVEEGWKGSGNLARYCFQGRQNTHCIGKNEGRKGARSQFGLGLR